MKTRKCLLKEANCDMRCAICGWNKEVEERRNKLLAEKGLTLCSDGLKRLVIKREG